LTLLSATNSEPVDTAVPPATHTGYQWLIAFNNWFWLHDERMMLAKNF
jgi:hypothetical protein